MFSKAKLKRFNESVGCAPPPTKYNTKIDQKIQNVAFDKTNRFIEGKENTPAPNSYMGVKLTPVMTPRKRMLSVPKLNISACSSSSASSQTGFLSPRPPFMRSRSLRTAKQKVVRQNDLQNKIDALTSEREILQFKVDDLEEKMHKLNIEDATLSQTKVLCESSTQVNDSFDERDTMPVNSAETERSSTPASVSISTEQYQLMKDELEHLTLLRDNLESSIANKDDLIADLHNQVDLMVDEAQGYQTSSIYFKEEADRLLDQLNKTVEERKAAEYKVSTLVARYEMIIQRQSDDRQTHTNSIAEKDVQIELLNDSVSILTTKVSEYGNQLSKIPNLETRIGDLSLEAKEKEVVETMLQSELEEKHNQMVKLEQSLLCVSSEVDELRKEKDELVVAFCDVDTLREELSVEIEQLRMRAKETDVLQQFLEKEITAREAEITEYTVRISSLEADFESTQALAMDLQQDAEAQLNQIFCLKASMSVKEYDIEAKDDAIERLTEKFNMRCEEPCTFHNESKNSVAHALEEELQRAREFMRSSLENTTQLEERVLQLVADIGEREDVHKKRILEKDSELEELSVKYSDALLEHDDIKRLLNHTSEELDKERMILEATDMELNMVKGEFKNKVEQNRLLDMSVKELTLKLTHVEDALACEEANARDSQDKLEEKIDLVEECLGTTKQELDSLKSSSSGYMSQITQLRIDMQKKCCAVDEMQGCIDALRQEKSELNSSYSEMKNSFNDKETLLTDLQNEFEGKLKTITELQDQVGQKDGEIIDKDDHIQELSNKVASLTLEKDQSESSFIARIEEAKSQWMKEQKLRIALEAKAEEIQDGLTLLTQEKEKIINDISSTLIEKEAKLSALEKNLLDLEAKYDGYDDQIKNLQITLQDRTIEVERFERSHNEINLAVECQQESSVQLRNHLRKLEDDQGFLNQSLLDKDQMLSDLNHSMLLKSDELQELQKEIIAKEDKMRNLEDSLLAVKQQLDENVTEFQSGLDKICEFDDILATKRANELSLTQKMQSLTAELHDLRIEQTVRESDVQLISNSLQEEVNFWRNKFEYLEKMIEPFKEQLSAYDLERAALVSESSAAQQECDKLSRDYAKLLGHTNHKQKIQHVAKIKEENNQLKKEVTKLRQDIDSLRHSHRKLEELTGARQKTTFGGGGGGGGSKRDNKENSACSVQDPNTVLSPLRSSNKMNRI